MSRQSLPHTLIQLANDCNIPQDILETVHQEPQANLVLSVLAIGFQQLQTNVSQLRTENENLRLAATSETSFMDEEIIFTDNPESHLQAEIERLRSNVEELRGQNERLQQTLSAQGAEATISSRDRRESRRTGRAGRRSSLPRSQRFPASSDITAALIQACENGHDSLVQLILGHAEVDINAQDANGSTPLLNAALNNHKRIVQQLLKQPNINVNIKNNDGSTPLLLAAEYSLKPTVQALLSHRDVDVNARDDDGDTALSVAAMAGRDDIVLVLLQHAKGNINVNALDDDGRTPLSWAASRCNLHRRNETETAPALKTEKQSQAVVKVLLGDRRVNANLGDNNGKSPLHYAEAAGFSKVANLLRTKESV